MEISVNKLYLYNDIRRLLLREENALSFDMDNAPMNKKPMKLHKGVDNTLYFKVFSPDNRAVKLCGQKVYGRIVDLENNELLYENSCRPGPQDGVLMFDVPEIALLDIKKGLYSLSLTREKNLFFNDSGVIKADPVFSDYDSNMSLTIEVTDQAHRMPRPSFYVGEGDWHETRTSNSITNLPYSRFESSSISANKNNFSLGSLHSFSVHAESFSGKLEILGTLDLTPNPDSTRSWFKISVLDDEDYLQFLNFTGTRMFNFEGQYMWIKFRYTLDDEVQDNGKITKIITRF